MRSSKATSSSSSFTPFSSLSSLASLSSLSSLSVLVLGLIGAGPGLLGVGCGEPPSGPPAPRSVEPASRAAGAAKPAPIADGAAPLAAPRIAVGGLVADDRDEPVVGRTVGVVDHAGRRSEVMTDEAGGFHVADVEPPYDLIVEAAPSGAIISPVAYLGLRRADPRIEVFERQGPLPVPASQPLRVGVHVPPCPRLEGACWVSVVSTSASGGGATAASYVEGIASLVLDLEHAYHAPSLAPSEEIAVHALVGDAAYSRYAYARLGHVPAGPGVPTDLGMLAPLPVPATDAVTLAAQSDGVPSDWQWTLASWLDLPGGASFSLRHEWSPFVAMRLPRLTGASFRVGAWAQHPPPGDGRYFHRSSQARSGTLPLGALAVAVDVPAGPASVRPEPGGQLSRRGLGLAWGGPSPSLSSVVLVDLAHARQLVRLHTHETAVSLARLEALGLPRLEVGEHVLDRTTTPGAVVDELVQPDARMRGRRFDQTVPGATTYLRFAFHVTP